MISVSENALYPVYKSEFGQEKFLRLRVIRTGNLECSRPE